MHHILYYQSPIGVLEIKEENNCIVGVRRMGESEEILQTEEEGTCSTLLAKARTELTEYFSGTRTTFRLPIAFTTGTPFQNSVWNALRDIPYGETCSYEDIAAAIGNPKAVRAIGQANKKNPLLLLVPCHRVINKNGSIGGFACGVEIKEQLLQLERETKGGLP